MIKNLIATIPRNVWRLFTSKKQKTKNISPPVCCCDLAPLDSFSDLAYQGFVRNSLANLFQEVPTFGFYPPNGIQQKGETLRLAPMGVFEIWGGDFFFFFFVGIRCVVFFSLFSMKTDESYCRWHVKPRKLIAFYAILETQMQSNVYKDLTYFIYIIIWHNV